MPITDDNIINIIFNPGKGRCETRTVEAEKGKRFPTLPKAKREGYEFKGWYTSREGGTRVSTGDIVEFNEDTVLYAVWVKASDSEVILDKRKNRTMLRKQKRAIVILVAAVVLLATLLGVVNYIIDIYFYDDFDGVRYYIKKSDGVYGLYNKDGSVCDINDEGYYQTKLGTQLEIDPETGEHEIYAVVDTEGTEMIGYSGRVLMFRQLTYDESSTLDQSRVIKSIEVHNEYGGYTFERNDDMDFVIKGNEDVAYNKESFAKLAVACGYTLSMQRLENPRRLSDGSIDLAEYGLCDQTRTKTETDEDGNEVTVEYEYSPAWYVITTMTGEQHKVIIGDQIVSGAGYYAQYEGRDTIYILNSSGFSDVMLQKLEAVVTPLIIYPMSTTTNYNVADFRIYKDIDYKAIEEEIIDKYGDSLTDMDEEELTKIYFETFEKYSTLMCDFSFQDLDERANSMYSTLPYISHLEYSGGYYINSDNISNMLYLLASMEFVEVVKLNPTDEDLEEYGLVYPEYIVDFLYHSPDEEDEEIYIANHFEVSSKNKDGQYYAYSDTYDMIVCVDESYFTYLEWEEVDWYDPEYVQFDISFIKDIIIESPGYSTHFKFENSASKIADYFSQIGNQYTDSGNNVYKIEKGEDGKYVLTHNGERVNPIYRGDYLVSALVYNEGVNEYGEYAFVETKIADSNNDGTNDTVTYYYYYVTMVDGKYTIATRIVTTDTQGNRIATDQTRYGTPYYTSDYFVTSNGFLYFTSKSSYMGKTLDEKYGAYKNGEWHTGNVFLTADGAYVLVDSEDGTWAEVKGVTSGLYFGDKDDSMLSKTSIQTTPRYNEFGELTRPPETYYATTTEQIRYNESTGKVEVYNSTKKEWENATFDDCTIGLWNTGAYYKTESGEYIIINEETGDWGIMTLSTTNSSNAYVFADDVLLDYIIKTTSSTGRVQDSTATYNFRQFYKALLYASLEGMSDLSDEEMAALRELDDFSSTDPNNPCQLKITIYCKDNSGNERNLVYRFYRYTERKSYITIEVLDEADSSNSDSTKGYGNFYVLGSFIDKIISDAQKVVNGEEVVSTSKY